MASPPGTSGFLTGVGILFTIFAWTYSTRGPGPFNLDPQNRIGAFEPFLAKYVRASEYIIGLATGSIVLLVGSSALHGQSGRLPWFYASSPLLLLAFCVIYGVAFMVLGGYGTHVDSGAALALGKPVILHSPDYDTLNDSYAEDIRIGTDEEADDSQDDGSLVTETEFGTDPDLKFCDLIQLTRPTAHKALPVFANVAGEAVACLI